MMTNLKAGNVWLREIQASDLDEINRWRNTPEILSTLSAPFRFISKCVDETWLANYFANRNAQVRCAICVEGTEPLIGLVSLVDIDLVNRRAESYLLIGSKKHHGKGIGTFALRRLLQHGFNDLGLHRIDARIIEYNAACLKLVEKLGFKVEGTLRDACFKEGKFHNLIALSLLSNEFGANDNR